MFIGQSVLRKKGKVTLRHRSDYLRQYGISYPCTYNMASLTNVITKQITVGTPNPATGTYISPTNLKEPIIPFYRFDLDTYNAACIAFETKIPASGNTSVTWNGPSDPDIYWLQSGDNIFPDLSKLGQQAKFFNISVIALV